MEKITDLLEKKGFFDVLFSLSSGDKSFNELEESLSLSPNTVLARLREMQKAGIIMEILSSDSGGRSKIKYMITDKGRKIVEESKSIQKDYLELRKKIKELEKQKDEKETEIRELLSSIQKSTAIVSISGGKIEKHGKGNLTIKAEVRNDSKIKKHVMRNNHEKK